MRYVNEYVCAGSSLEVSPDSRSFTKSFANSRALHASNSTQSHSVEYSITYDSDKGEVVATGSLFAMRTKFLLCILLLFAFGISALGDSNELNDRLALRFDRLENFSEGFEHSGAYPILVVLSALGLVGATMAAAAVCALPAMNKSKTNNAKLLVKTKCPSFTTTADSGALTEDPSPKMSPKAVTPINIISALRLRYQCIQDLEIEGLAGMGCAGRVYKAKWRGNTVAVKVIEYTLRPASLSVPSLLSQPVLSCVLNCPNTITCYHAAAVKLPAAATFAPKSTLPPPPPRTPPLPEAAQFEEEDLLSSGDDDVSAFFSEEYLDDAAGDFLTTTHRRTRDDPSRPRKSSLDIIDADRRSENVPRPAQLLLQVDLVRHPSMAEELKGQSLLDANSLGRPRTTLSPAPLAVYHQQRPILDMLESAVDGEDMSHIATRELEPAMATSPVCPGMYEIWMVMDWADLGSLSDAIKKGRLLCHRNGMHNVDGILSILLDVARGMLAIHELGIIHGALRAGNVMLQSSSSDPRGYTARVGDFGLYNLLDTVATHVNDRIQELARYCAPEIVHGSCYNVETDIFAFGLLMYEVWKFEKPYHDLHPCEIMAGLGRGMRPDIPTNCPYRYGRLMASCWDEAPCNRPTFDLIVRDLSGQLTFLRNAKLESEHVKGFV